MLAHDLSQNNDFTNVLLCCCSCSCLWSSCGRGGQALPVNKVTVVADLNWGYHTKNDRRNSGGTLRQRYLKDIPKISQRYPKDISKISQRYLKDILKISQKYPKDIPKISKRYPKDIQKISQRYPKDISKISQRYP